MKRREIVLVSLGMGLLGIGTVTFIISRGNGNHNDNQTPLMTQHKNNEYGVGLSYPSDLEVSPITEEDKEAKIFLRLQHRKAPEYLITARAETGLRTASQLARLSILDLVQNGALKALPGRYDRYKLTSEKRITVGGREAQEIIFSYSSPEGGRAKQKLIQLFTNSDTAVYLSIQSRERDFEKLNSSVFDQIVRSISYLDPEATL